MVVALSFRRALVATVVAGGASVAAACSGDSEPGPVGASAGAPPSGTGGATASTGGKAASMRGGSPSSGGSSPEPTAEAGAGGAGRDDASGGGESSAGESSAGESAGGSTPGGSTGGRATGGGGTTGGGAPAAGGAGAGGRDPACPKTLTTALLSNSKSCSSAGLECPVEVDCNTGSRLLVVTCENDTWQVPKGCNEPFNFCVDASGGTGTQIAVADCEDREWVTDVTNNSFGPIPCPAEPPPEEMPCDAIGGTESGGDRKHCGYPCAATESWTVISCTGSGIDAKWRSDGACD